MGKEEEEEGWGREAWKREEKERLGRRGREWRGREKGWGWEWVSGWFEGGEVRARGRRRRREQARKQATDAAARGDASLEEQCLEKGSWVEAWEPEADASEDSSLAAGPELGRDPCRGSAEQGQSSTEYTAVLGQYGLRGNLRARRGRVNRASC